MGKLPSTDTKEGIEIFANNNNPALMCDSVNLAARADGIYLMRFLASLPEGLLEQAKILMPEKNFKELIEIMCERVNYYPTKPKTPKKAAKAKK